MSEMTQNTSEQIDVHALSGEDLRMRAHQIIDNLPHCELKAAIIALEELKVSVQVRQECLDRHTSEV